METNELLTYFRKLIIDTGAKLDKFDIVFIKSRLDLLCDLNRKSGFNARGYLRYFLTCTPKENGAIKSCYLVSRESVRGYVEWDVLVSQYSKILGYFDKSVNNIVEVCTAKKILSTKEYIEYLIMNDVLGEEVITGNISLYFLAAIPNFDKTLQKLFEQRQTVSVKTLDFFLEDFDIYENRIRSAFWDLRGMSCNSLEITDKKIRERLRHPDILTYAAN